MRVFWLLAALAALILLSATGALAKRLEPVELHLHWVHQAQFAGYYVAQDQGIYAKYGLKVSIHSGGPGSDPLDDLAHKRCRFGTGWLAEGILHRAGKAPLVHLAQIVQRSGLLLVMHGAKGKPRLEDLAGKRVSMWGRHLSLATRALFKSRGIKVQEVPQGSTMELFLSGAVAASEVMAYNEKHRLYQAGFDPGQLVFFNLAGLGFNFPEDAIFALKDTWLKNPGLCRRFVAASLEGWRRAFADPEAALASVMDRVAGARRRTNPALQAWMLRSMQGLITHGVGRERMGRLDPKALARVKKVLAGHGLLKGPMDDAEFAVPAWRPE